MNVASRLKLGKSSFMLLAMASLLMAIATFVEKFVGTAQAWTYIYGSPWFGLLWIAIVILAVVYIFHRKGSMTRPGIFLHLALMVILLGALLTRLTGQNGTIRLHLNRLESNFELNDGTITTLPFSIRLDTFRVIPYPCTQTPADYQSVVSVIQQNDNKSKTISISMNHIGRIGIYRFYQSSFSDNQTNSVLTVNKDPFGIVVTYSGYALLGIFMLWSLMAPQGKFRILLRHPLLKQGVMLVTGAILLFNSGNIHAQCLSADSLTIVPSQADSLQRLCVLYNGRVTPLQTLAIDFTRKLCSSNHFREFSSVQFFAGWLFFPEKWQYIPIFEVKDTRILESIGLKRGPATLADFFTSERNYKLQPFLKNASSKNGFGKEILSLHERINLIFTLHNGGLMKIFPQTRPNGIDWFAPQLLPPAITPAESLFIQNIVDVYKQNILSGQAVGAWRVLHKISVYQHRKAGNTLPSKTKLKTEILYNQLNIFDLLFKVNLSLGLLGLMFLFRNLILHKISRWFNYACIVGLSLSFLFLTAALLMRTYISGNVPLSNGFETMLFVAWLLMGIGLLLSFRSKAFPVFALFLSGICLLVAHLGINNPQITPLVPVLQSVWLNLHVSLMMLSYALAAFISLFGLSSLILMLSVTQSNRNRLEVTIRKLTLLSQVFLYPCVFMMAGGIFLGAIWANQSWGRYWGWDPKESWALITWIGYAFLFHARSLRFLNNYYIFNTLSFIAILLVLMTFFGVNNFLGGMHSYAGNADIAIGWWLLAIAALITVFLIRTWQAYLKNPIHQSRQYIAIQLYKP